MVGIPLKAPLTALERIYTLPMLTISMKKGTAPLTPLERFYTLPMLAISMKKGTQQQLVGAPDAHHLDEEGHGTP
ncbi:hypothetical protein T484DRAFT_1873352 [Baffinella frigidus]|nr:hypothetical protein T484DRAFT_1873352 [Cryptophyta sp. CCMP2293]